MAAEWLIALVKFLSLLDWPAIIFKFVLVTFALIYLGYSVIFLQQVRRMSSNYQATANGFLLSLSYLELLIAIVFTVLVLWLI